MGKLALTLIRKAKISESDIKSIGVGSPGTPNKKKGLLVYSNNLGFHNVDIRSGIQKHLKKDVFLDNDANCAALAESVVGACRGTKSSFMITLGTGVGGGVVIDNKIYNGFNYGAPEIGHMVIVADGRQCTCGRRGCWEMYSSATGLVIDTNEASRKYPGSKLANMIKKANNYVSARTAFEAMRNSCDIGKMVVENYIKLLALGLINVINIFQPEVIAIGGGVSNEKDNLLNPLIPIIEKEIYTRYLDDNTKIVIASAGNDAGIIGAAMLNE